MISTGPSGWLRRRSKRRLHGTRPPRSLLGRGRAAVGEGKGAEGQRAEPGTAGRIRTGTPRRESGASPPLQCSTWNTFHHRPAPRPTAPSPVPVIVPSRHSRGRDSRPLPPPAPVPGATTPIARPELPAKRPALNRPLVLSGRFPCRVAPP